jgi:hypothetical protein
MSLIRENDGILRDLRDLMGITENLVRKARASAVAGRAAISAQVIACFQELNREAGGAEAWVLREAKKPWRWSANSSTTLRLPPRGRTAGS